LGCNPTWTNCGNGSHYSSTPQQAGRVVLVTAKNINTVAKVCDRLSTTAKNFRTRDSPNQATVKVPNVKWIGC
jgi:hypothetical protein